MEMVWARVRTVTRRIVQDSLTLDSGWQKEHGDEQCKRRVKNAA